MKIIPTILCGGAGSRLWPVSRETHPKPFIRLADGQSLLQKAFLRGASVAGCAEVLTVTNRELLFKTQDEFREVNSGKLPTSFILEPFGRNTAPAVTLAALAALEAGNDPVLVVTPADQTVTDEAAFTAALRRAVGVAAGGAIAILGITPDRPETG